MSTITTRSGKGSPLTNNEVDNNFTNLNTDKAELSGATFTGEIVANGGIDVTGTVTADGLTVDANTATFSAGTSGDMILVLEADTDNNEEGDTPKIQFKMDGGNTFGHVGFVGTDGDLFTGSTANSLALGTDVNTRVQFYTFDTLRQQISNNGDISFYEDTGTTAKFFWDASAERLNLTGDGTSLSLLGATQNIAGGSSNLKIGSSDAAAEDKGGQLNFTANTTTLSNYPVAGIHGYHETLGASNYSGYLSLFTTSSAGGITERMRIDSSGRVGIGTSSPSAKLDVAGTVNAYGNGSVALQWGDTSALGYLSFDGSANPVIRSASSKPLVFQTSGANERMRIDSSGNVGIGTSSPQAKLDVAAVSNFSTSYNTFTGDGLHIQCTGTGGADAYSGGISFSRISADNNSRAAGIAGVQGADADHLGLAFFTHPSLVTSDALVEAMRIDSSGNVGIGTSSPDTLMEIASTSPVLRITNTTDAAWSAGQDIGRLSFYSTDASAVGPHETAFILNESDFGSGVTQLSGALSFGTAAYNAAATERMRIDSSGNVGIGTDSPTGAKLRVVAESGSNVLGVGTTTQGLFIKTTGTTVDYNSSGDSGGEHTFSTGNTERMRIDSNGDVSFYEDTGTTAKFFWDASAESLQLGSIAPQTPAIFNLRSNGTNIEFGHGNRTSGYFGTLGASANNGQPYLGFSAHADGGIVNTFTTKGFKGNVIEGDATGNLTFNQLTNANASGQSLTERMRIDSSGNLLVGKTASNSNTVGFQAGQNGFTAITRASGQPLILDRTTTDGAIQDFRKDGTTVGSIGTSTGYTKITSGDGTNGSGLQFGDSKIYPVEANSVVTDNAVDFGDPSYRFKDLYLSGGANVGSLAPTTSGAYGSNHVGVHIGGITLNAATGQTGYIMTAGSPAMTFASTGATIQLGGLGAANKLDDYETGTWTPTAATIGIAGNLGARYTKIGNLVTLTCQIIFDASASTDGILLGGLPFAAISSQAPSSSGVMHSGVTLTGGRTSLHAYITNSQSTLNFYESGSGLAYQSMTINNMSNSSIVLNIQYMTDY